MAYAGDLQSDAALAADPAQADERMSRDSWRVLIFVFLAWIIDAADSTIYSLTLPSIRDEFGLSLTTMGMIASIFLAGTVIGALTLPVLAERKGRRIGMVACIGIFSVFTGLVGLAWNAATVAIGRFFTGIGTGAEWPIGAAYLCEMVPAKRRGLAMAAMQAGYPVGYFLAGAIFAIFAWLGLGWRGCYVVLVLPALMCIPVITLLRESPTWLRNRREPQRAVPAGEARVARSGYGELFAPKYRRTTIIATALHVFGAIFSYGLVVWVPSAIIIDFHIDKAQVAYFVMFSWGVGTFGYLAAGRLSDRFGRKIVLCCYTILGLVAILTLNYMLRLPNVTLLQLLLPGTLIGISLGVSAIYITYTSEIYPSHIRTMGLGFSVALGKITAVFVPTVLGAVAQMSSVSLSLLLSTAIGLLMVPTVLFGPETAGRKLEEISAET